MRISIRLWIGLGVMLWSAVAQAGEWTTRDALKHVGETATVCGIVVSPVYRPDVRGQPTFLNLDRPYPNQDFIAVIRGEDRAAFGSPEVELWGSASA